MERERPLADESKIPKQKPSIQSDLRGQSTWCIFVSSVPWMYISISFYSNFIEIYFLYYTIYPFNVCDSAVFKIFSVV